MSPAVLLTDHLTRLTDSLNTLKDRVRVAVVGELSRIASDTLNEVIRLAITHNFRSGRIVFLSGPSHFGATCGLEA